MSTTTLLALLILFCSVTVLFSQEIGGIAKKIMAYPGMKLLLPLAGASFILLCFEPWWAYVLFSLQQQLFSLLALSSSQLGMALIKLVLLLTLSLLPRFLLELYLKKNPHLNFKKTGFLNLLLWLLALFLLNASF